MFEPIEGAEFTNDGCNYLTEEEMLAFSKMVTPSEFDSSIVPNNILNVPYGPLPEQLLDIYKPEKGEGPFPVLYYVHGGGWLEGTKTMCPLEGIIGAVNEGYIVISVNYRLAPAVTFPEFLYDVKTAIRWGRAHASQYAFDAERFAIAGDSAGGHLALMAGFTAGHPEYAAEEYGWAGYSDELQAVCDIYGPSTLVDPMVPFYLESGVPRAMRDIAGQPTIFDIAFGTSNKALLKLISPISYVHKNIPPTLILHGESDGIIPCQHSRLLYEKINAVCGAGRAELVLYPGRNHADYGFNTDENALVLTRFLDRYLK